MPQIILTVPPEVIRLLTGILSSLQRLEAEVRDCRVRLGHSVLPVRSAVAATPATPASIATEPATVPRGRVHTPAGRKAADRMRALRDGLGLSIEHLAPRLGISGTMVGNIEGCRNGISMRVDEAMRKLETTNGGRP